MDEQGVFYQAIPKPRLRRTRLNARRRRRSATRYLTLYVFLVSSFSAVVLFAIPAMAQVGLEPGPDDGLSVEEYERRIDGWCTVLVRDWGWTRDVDGSVTGWEGGCWRDDERPSHKECLRQGFEWDCPIPGEEPESLSEGEDFALSGAASIDEDDENGEDMPIPTVIEAGSGGLR